jgi:putative aldouronate transport system permease protein
MESISRTGEYINNKTVRNSAGNVKKTRAGISAKTAQLYSLAGIPLLLVFVFNYLPMFGIVIAFKDYKFDKGIFGSEWVGLDNFIYFFKSGSFWLIAKNTILLNGLFIVTGVVSAVALAVILFEITSRNNVKIYQTILITPNFLSWVVAGYMAYAILNPEYGFLNSLTASLGGEGKAWYSMPEVWPGILNAASVWKHIGMDSVVYYASLMSIDSELFEAAEVDGANKWHKIKNITLPHLGALVTVLVILKIGNIFRADFGLFYQLTRDVGALYPTTDVMDTYVFRTMRVIRVMSMSSAAGLLQSVVGFALVMATNFTVKKFDPDRALF